MPDQMTRQDIVARWLYEHDDYPLSCAPSGWNRIMAATEHSGDCTNECHSCAVCTRERFQDMAAKFITDVDHIGLVLLPKEATEAMRLATRDYDWPHTDTYGRFAARDTDSAADEIYSAMAAAFEEGK